MNVQNAVLTAIYAPAPTDLSGEPTGAGATLWSGRAACYLRKTQHLHSKVQFRQIAQGETTLVRTDTLYILDSAGAPVLEQAGERLWGSRIAVEDWRSGVADPKTYQVSDVEHRAAASIADSTRLMLDDEQPDPP